MCGFTITGILSLSVPTSNVRVLRWIRWALPPVMLIGVNGQMQVSGGWSWRTATIGAAVSVIAILTLGLVVVRCVAVTVSRILLAQQKVLSQELAAVEVLARIGIPSLDKLLYVRVQGVGERIIFGDDRLTAASVTREVGVHVWECLAVEILGCIRARVISFADAHTDLRGTPSWTAQGVPWRLRGNTQRWRFSVDSMGCSRYQLVIAQFPGT